MDTNRHKGFCGEAALECGGLTPLSGTKLLLVTFGVTDPTSLATTFGVLGR